MDRIKAKEEKFFYLGKEYNIITMPKMSELKSSKTIITMIMKI